MNFSKQAALPLAILIIFFVQFSNATPEIKIKPFKRALILGGGGIQPGLGLGYLAAAEELGWKPDIIIATCGASLPTAVYDKFHTAKDSLQYMKSQAFFDTLQKIQIDTPNLLSMQKKFKDLEKYPNVIPDFFKGNALFIPEQMNSIFANEYFRNEANKPRIIILTARAHFKKEDIGKEKTNLLRFTKVLMTDVDTADHLKDFKNPLNDIFPALTVEQKIETLTYSSTENAMRASISDPFLVNPGMYENFYYFTGAVDLYPIDIANYLADEVISTYPASLFKDFENLAIKSTFGVPQSSHVLYALQDNNIKWVDQALPPKGMSFDPAPVLLTLTNKIPKDPDVFNEKIQQQYDFGYARMKELLSLKQTNGTFTKHLR